MALNEPFEVKFGFFVTFFFGILEIDHGKVGHEKVAENLHIVRVWHVQSLAQIETLQGRVLIHFIRVHNQMVEVLFDQHAVNLNKIVQIFILLFHLCVLLHHLVAMIVICSSGFPILNCWRN